MTTIELRRMDGRRLITAGFVDSVLNGWSLTTGKSTRTGVSGRAGLRPIADDDPHLLAGAFEASQNGQRCHLAIDLDSGFVDRLGLLGCLVKAPKDLILIQHDINAIRVDLDADNACAHKCAEAFDPLVTVLLGKISRALDQPLLASAYPRPTVRVMPASVDRRQAEIRGRGAENARIQR